MGLELIKTGRQNKPPRIIVMGTRGVGKSTLCAQSEKPIMIMTEDGLGLLDVPHFPLARSFDEVIGHLGSLYKDEHDYKTVVLDSLDWAEKLIHEAVRAEHGQDIFTTYGKGYTFAVPLIERLLKAFDALRDKRGMTVLLTAHTQVKRFSSPETDPYDRWELDLHQKAAATCEEWADAVLFATQKVYTKSTDVGFNQKQTRGVGSGERVLLTEERPSHSAKNRYRLPYELPLDYKNLMKCVLGE